MVSWSEISRREEHEGGSVPRAISKIEVENLFGRYDYEIPIDKDVANPEIPRVCLLYGDNGTGKTTILKLIFHLLSASDNRGHRTYVARTPFRRFDIVFSDSSRITATRQEKELVGGFNLEFKIGEGQPEVARIDTDPATGGVSSDSNSPQAEALAEKISDLELDVFYLGDTRDLEGDAVPRREWRSRRSPTLPYVYEHRGGVLIDDGSFMLNDPTDVGRESTLLESIRRTERVLNREVMRASSAGETDARQVYADILNTIASANAPEREALNEEVTKIEKDLQRLGSTSRNFERFGLGSAMNVEALSESLENANSTTLPVVVQLLSSFLEGQEARLNAHQSIYDLIHSFVETINGYFSDKSVEFSVFDGLTISLPDGTLRPDGLSSGEQHLLLLFLNTITPSRRSPLFIIDEPELSLNIKWQRNLVDSLLELSESSKCQFLMATHSIELLTKHMEHVHRLTP